MAIYPRATRLCRRHEGSGRSAPDSLLATTAKAVGMFRPKFVFCVASRTLLGLCVLSGMVRGNGIDVANLVKRDTRNMKG